jgi:Holliday junction resolvasome RuvABC endonuclease subunit
VRHSKIPSGRVAQPGAVVLGLDPGFAAIGWAIVRLEAERETLLHLGCFVTQKSDKKRAVKAADDNMRRAQEISVWLQNLMQAVGHRAGDYEPISLVCAESMSFPRNASAAAKVALTWGVIAAKLSGWNGLPLVQASPQEVKLAACGAKNASKLDVAQAMRKRFGPKAYDGACLRSKLPAGLLEHPVDALATVVACLDSNLVRLVRPKR